VLHVADRITDQLTPQTARRMARCFGDSSHIVILRRARNLVWAAWHRSATPERLRPHYQGAYLMLERIIEKEITA
jgi:hypothetical protein